VTLWAAEPTVPDRDRSVAAESSTGLNGCVIPWGEITVGRQLGAGGFGIVLAATWRQDDVAVKRIRPELIASQGAAARSEFRRELELLCSLRHRHIVQCYGGDATDHFFVVTELMERGSLDDCLEAHPNEFAWARLGRRVLLDVAKGLLYLHGRGLVHFDVSRSMPSLLRPFAACLLGTSTIAFATTYNFDLPPPPPRPSFSFHVQHALMYPPPALLSPDPRSRSVRLNDPNPRNPLT
jgi:serine/threonine protein kinase